MSIQHPALSLYCKAGLLCGIVGGVTVERQPLLLSAATNKVWSIDLVTDALCNECRLKCLTIVDDFTKEAVDIVVDHGISDQCVAARRATRASGSMRT